MSNATMEESSGSAKPKIAEQPIMQVQDLAVSFDNGSGPRIQAVDGVRMTVYPRQTLAVVG
ncbi:MAG: ABC transporter ATP-binding protein, partial [bacterium]|nr:ABC transporter ATP-binding protein [bacterium]